MLLDVPLKLTKEYNLSAFRLKTHEIDHSVCIFSNKHTYESHNFDCISLKETCKFRLHESA